MNLIGALYLGSLFGSPALVGKQLVGLLGFVQVLASAGRLGGTANKCALDFRVYIVGERLPTHAWT